MNFLPLLGKQLKDDAVIEILEFEEMEVVYDFDRLHENTPDVYWAESTEKGFQFRFDANQILDTIFLYAANIDDFVPVSREDCDIHFFPTINEAETYGIEGKAEITKGKPPDFLGISREWVRLEYATYSLHYEFRREGLAVVTLTNCES